MPVTEKKYKTTAFDQHGVLLSLGSKQLSGDCPFCGKEEHFFANPKTFQWDCKSCLLSGNLFSFLSTLHARSLSKTKPADYKALASLRGIDFAKSLQTMGFAKSFLLPNVWLFPMFNRAGSLNGLLHYDLSRPPDDRAWMNTADTSPSLLQYPSLTTAPAPDPSQPFSEENPPIYVAEGVFDTAALHHLLTNAKVPGVVVGVPGAGGFRKECLSDFTQRHVFLCYDNDAAGEEGSRKAAELLEPVAASVRTLRWPASLARGFDVSDFIKQRLSSVNVKKCYKDFFLLFDDSSPSSSDRRSPKSGVTSSSRETAASHKPIAIGSIIKKFRETIHFDSNMEQALAILYAAAISNKLPGDPIWIYLVGPPGCLAGDTIVEINRAGKSYRDTIANVVHSFNGGTRGPGKKFWNPEIPTTIRGRDSDGCVRLFPLIGAVASGLKQTYRLTLEDGREIVATEDHQFLTVAGWKPLKQLSLEDLVYCDAGKPSPRPDANPKAYYPSIEGLHHHPYAGRRNPNSRGERRYTVPTHRLVVEADMNGMTLKDFILCLRSGTEKPLTFLKPDQIVHHLDRNTTNYELSNLEVYDSLSTHSSQHGVEGGFKRVTATTAPVKVQSIVPDLHQETYDLQVGHEAHNFLANGVVVHNSGKTLVLESFRSHKDCVFRSKLSSKSLISGFVPDDPSQDPSLIPIIKGKTFVLKDFTEVLALSHQDQDSLFGVLRGCFDGVAEQTFANGVTRVYDNCRFALIAGVTDSIHRSNRATMGERFLKFDFLREGVSDTNLHVSAALASLESSVYSERTIGLLTERFLSQPFPSTAPKIPTAYAQRLVALARLVASLRANVERDSKGDLSVRPRIEIATRLVRQLGKLLKCLSLVYAAGTKSKPKIDDRCYDAVERCGLDSVIGWNLDIVRCFLPAPSKPLTTHEIQLAARIGSASSVKRLLANLVDLQILIPKDRAEAVVERELQPTRYSNPRIRELKQEESCKVGHPPNYYYLCPEFHKLWIQAKLDRRFKTLKIAGGK